MTTERYLDDWGDLWVRIDEDHVKRVKDGMIGAWRNGDGLTPTRQLKQVSQSKPRSDRE